MARRFQRFRTNGSEATNEINISPLIDIVFILLIFFIVTTVFVEETGIDIEKPQAASQEGQLERESILIGVTSQGNVYYGGREIGVGGVRSVVGRLLKQGDAPVIIQADRRTPTEKTVSVLDQAKLAGAARVFVSTVVE